jgi:hypothetical protein
MKLKAIFIALSLILSSATYSQAIKDTKYGRDDPTNLTDQDKDISENFFHEGKAQRVYVEECTKDGETEAACLGKKADPKIMGMKSSMIGMLAKAYTMVIGMGGVGGDLATTESIEAEEANEAAEKAAEKSGEEAKTTDASKKEQKDYCKYIPVATETIAMFNTTEDQKTIGMLPQSQESAQKESLLKAAENHESRAKTAKIQTTGWGAGTACYVTMMSIGGGWTSGKNLLKLGASSLLTWFYSEQIGAHEDYADKTRAVADKLPGKGDCNPITDKACFCTEESSKKRPDYLKYCRPTLHKRGIAYKSERLACIDENMKEDPGCSCAQRDTCVDKKVMTTIKGFGGGTIGSMPMFADFSQLSKGELTAKSLNAANSTFNSAIKKLKELDRKLPETNSILNKKQKEEFKLLTDMGMPPKLAKKMAQMPVTPEMKKNMAKFDGASTGKSSRRSRYSNSSSRKKKSNVLTFSGGDGVNRVKKSKKSNKNDFLKRFGLKKKKRNKANGKVLKFANRAQSQAQISRNKNRHIFDIISRRYQVSGWKRLEYIKD